MSAESALIGQPDVGLRIPGRSRLPALFAAVGVLPDEDQLLVAEGTTVRLLDPKTGELGRAVRAVSERTPRSTRCCA